MERAIPKPVILFLDGHSSHLSLHVSTFCAKENIILISLYPNTTHICQPLDVSVFKPLKTKWRDDVRIWRSNNFDEKLTRTDFCPLLRKALDELTVETVANGFKHCGLYPFTSDVIPAMFDRKKHRKNPEPNDSLKDYQKKTALHLIESMIGQQKLSNFKNDSFSVEDDSLYRVWKNLIPGQKGNISKISLQKISTFSFLIWIRYRTRQLRTYRRIIISHTGNNSY